MRSEEDAPKCSWRKENAAYGLSPTTHIVDAQLIFQIYEPLAQSDGSPTLSSWLQANGKFTRTPEKKTQNQKPNWTEIFESYHVTDVTFDRQSLSATTCFLFPTQYLSRRSSTQNLKANKLSMSRIWKIVGHSVLKYSFLIKKFSNCMSRWF